MSKKASKKTVSKKSVAKKSPAKKTPAKPTKKTAAKPVKKVSKKVVKKAAQKPAKKASAKPAKASSPKKAVASKKAPAAKKVRKAVSSADLLGSVPVSKPDKPVKTPFNAKQLKEFRKLLLNHRDRLVDEVSFLAGDNLNRSQREASGDLSSYSFHMADQGTDNWDREFALNMVSTEQDVIYEVEEALRRIDNKTYGVCEISFEPIEIERLKAIPYARYSLKAQSELEKNRHRHRSFGVTVSNGE